MSTSIKAVIVCNKDEKVYNPRFFTNKVKNYIKSITERGTQYVYDCDAYMRSPCYPLDMRDSIVIDPNFVDPYVPTFTSVEKFLEVGIRGKVVGKDIVCFQPELIKELIDHDLVTEILVINTNRPISPNQPPCGELLDILKTNDFKIIEDENEIVDMHLVRK